MENKNSTATMTMDAGRKTVGAGMSAMEAFEKLEKVGEGTYGKVYRARERATGKIVALKKTRLHEDEEGVPPTTLREISLLRMLSRDPHIVSYFFELMKVSLITLRPDSFDFGVTTLQRAIVFYYLEDFTLNRTLLLNLLLFLISCDKQIDRCQNKDKIRKGRRFCIWRNFSVVSVRLEKAFLPRLLRACFTSFAKELLSAMAMVFCTGLLRFFWALLTTQQQWTCGLLVAYLVSFTFGDSELQQLLHIFRLLGTPNEQVWPGVSKLVNWHEYPQWKPQPLSSSVPNLDENGLNLLASSRTLIALTFVLKDDLVKLFLAATPSSSSASS
nr:cell division control protein 2 homolog D [Ipomoea batatas]